MSENVKSELVSIGKGALIAVLGALVVYIPTITNVVDFGDTAPLVAAICAIAVNAIRKVITTLG